MKEQKVIYYQIRLPKKGCTPHTQKADWLEGNGTGGKAHFYQHIRMGVYRCKYCQSAVWMPVTLDDAIELNIAIQRRGKAGAYRHELERRPEVLKLLSELMREQMERIIDKEKIGA